MLSFEVVGTNGSKPQPTTQRQPTRENTALRTQKSSRSSRRPLQPQNGRQSFGEYYEQLKKFKKKTERLSQLGGTSGGERPRPKSEEPPRATRVTRRTRVSWAARGATAAGAATTDINPSPPPPAPTTTSAARSSARTRPPSASRLRQHLRTNSRPPSSKSIAPPPSQQFVTNTSVCLSHPRSVTCTTGTDALCAPSSSATTAANSTTNSTTNNNTNNNTNNTPNNTTNNTPITSSATDAVMGTSPIASAMSPEWIRKKVSLEEMNWTPDSTSVGNNNEQGWGTSMVGMRSPGPSAWGKEDLIFHAMYNIPTTREEELDSHTTKEELKNSKNEDVKSNSNSNLSQARVDCWQQKPSSLSSAGQHKLKFKTKEQAPLPRAPLPRAPKMKKAARQQKQRQQPVAASPSTRLFKMTRGTPQVVRMPKKFHDILNGNGAVKKKLALDLESVKKIKVGSGSSTSRTARTHANEVLTKKKQKEQSQRRRPQSAK